MSGNKIVEEKVRVWDERWKEWEKKMKLRQSEWEGDWKRERECVELKVNIRGKLRESKMGLWERKKECMWLRERERIWER